MNENSSPKQKLTSKRDVRIRIGGIAPFTATDYPGCLSAVLFCQGCPWRCRYCHNPHLQTMKSGDFKWPQVMYFLLARKNLLDGVVFSGGEPLIQPDLYRAMSEVKDLGFKIGLHTAGASVEKLREILSLVDWIGLDIKAPFEHYERITQVPGSGQMARACLDLIMEHKIPVQLRTTVHPLLLSEVDLAQLKQELEQTAADSLWTLQPFRSNGCLDAELLQGDA